MANLFRRTARKIIPKRVRKKILTDMGVVSLKGKIRFYNPLVRRAPLQEVKAAPGYPVFTIITPAYNCSSYLEDYFCSIFRQTYDMSQVEIIVVDDCSTDNTLEILRGWEKEYPNVSVIASEENRGQGAARNMAIPYARGEYVTFIDPDDFLEENYFSRIAALICRNPSVKIIATHPIFYFEGKGKYSNTHALNNQFKGNIRFFMPLDADAPIIMSSAYAVIHREEIGDLRFDDRIKPTFEDAHFMTRYQMGLSSGLVAVLPDAYYLYRKRADQSSSVDRSLLDPRQYDDVLRYGCLDLINIAKSSFGYVPRMVQKRLFYQIMWIYTQFLSFDSKACSVMEDVGRTRGFITDIAREVSPDIVASFPYRFPYAMRVSWLKYTGYNPSDYVSDVAIVRRIDCNKKRIRLYDYFGARYFLDGIEIFPTTRKRVSKSFLGDPFMVFDIVELSYEDENQILSILNRSNIECGVSFMRRAKANNWTVRELSMALHASPKRDDETSLEPDGSWVMMDRLDHADDNAEHLYRWILSNHPDKDVCFVLKEDSSDWNRLKDDGFNLLAYGSSAWKKKIFACSAIISSQFDAKTFNPFGNDFFFGTKKIVTLQHGVINNDLSSLMNRFPFDLFLTSSSEENKSIVENGSPYELMKQDVPCCGLPRWDMLNNADKNLLLIAPTWRRSLFSGSVYELVVDDVTGNDFASSVYAQNWHALLFDSSLKDFAEKEGLQICFKPHPNIRKFAEAGYFKVPDYVMVDYGTSYMSLCSKAAYVVTDYSSLPFDVAYAGGLAVYFHFDSEEFFSSHTYQRGYFDYEQHGFGPVIHSSDEIPVALSKLKENREKYLTRIDETFPVRDHENCKRAYEAILELFES